MEIDNFTAPDFGFTDTFVLVAYFIATMSIGFFTMRKGGRSVSGFTDAGRSLSGWLTGLSLLGAFVSSISFLAFPGKSYDSNWNPFSLTLSFPFAVWIAAKYFIPFYRRLSSVSAYEQLEVRFGAWARIYADICYLLTQLARMGAVTYLMALPMCVLLGWDIKTTILVTGISVTVYTLLGGILAVIWTEAIQTVVLLIGTVVCVMTITLSVPDGFSGILQTAGEFDKFSLGSFSLLEWGKSTFWVVFIYGLFVNLQYFGIDQNFVQRYMVTKTDAGAKRGLYLAGLACLPMSAMFYYIGTGLFCFYRSRLDLLNPAFADKPDYIFPYYIVTQLPLGFRGLLIAAVFAAAMSTISCSLNSSATIFLTDFYKRYVDKNAGEKRQLRFLRCTTIFWGFLGTFAAILFADFRNTLDAWWVISGIFSGGMLGLYLLEFFRKIDGFAAFCGVAAGILAIVWQTFSKELHAYWHVIPESPLNMFLVCVLGTCTVFVVGFFTVVLIGGKRRDSETDAKDKNV